MTKKLTTAFQQPYFYVCIIILGVLFKFIGLDSKFVWLDEVFTMSHTSGVQMEKFVDALPRDTIYAISDFNHILNMNEGDHTLGSQLSGLSQMVQVTPLHYYFLVFWHRLVGGEIIHFRLFSLFMFLLSVPILYFLMRELKASRLTSLVTVSLFSVSPFFHFYAQEARYYSLWGFAIILITLVLLKALRYNNFKWWMLYSLSAILALYVSTMSGVILAGHVFLVWFNYRDKWKPYFMAGVVAFMAYLPWILAIISDNGSIMESTSWQYEFKPVWQTILGPLYSMATTFYTAASDSGYWAIVTDWGNYSLDTIIVQTVLVAVILVASFNIFRDSSKVVVWVIACSSISYLALYYVFDFYSGRILSLVYRYHIPIMIMAVVVLGLYLGKQIERKRLPFTLLYTAIILGCVFSMYRISMNPCYHNHGNCERQLVCASEVSNNETALIIVGGNQWWMTYQFWELTHETDSDNIEILYDPEPERIKTHLTNKSYSAIYTFSIASSVEYSLLNYYKEKPSKQPLAISFADITDEFFNRDPWNKTESTMDTSIDLTLQNITINLILESKIPADTVYITGSHYTLGDWKPDLTPLQRNDDGHWSGNFSIEKGEGTILFNFTRGDLSHYLVDSENKQIHGFSHTIVGDTTINVEAWKWKDAGKL